MRNSFHAEGATWRKTLDSERQVWYSNSICYRFAFCVFRKREKLQTWSDKQNHEEKRPNGALAGGGFPTQKRLSERALWRVFGMFLLRALGRALFMDIRRRAFFVPAP